MQWQRHTVLVLGFKNNYKISKLGIMEIYDIEKTLKWIKKTWKAEEFQLLCNILCLKKKKLNYKAIENKNIKKTQKNGYK